MRLVAAAEKDHCSYQGFSTPMANALASEAYSVWILGHKSTSSTVNGANAAAHDEGSGRSAGTSDNICAKSITAPRTRVASMSVATIVLLCACSLRRVATCVHAPSSACACRPSTKSSAMAVCHKPVAALNGGIGPSGLL